MIQLGLIYIYRPTTTVYYSWGCTKETGKTHWTSWFTLTNWQSPQCCKWNNRLFVSHPSRSAGRSVGSVFILPRPLRCSVGTLASSSAPRDSQGNSGEVFRHVIPAAVKSAMSIFHLVYEVVYPPMRLAGEMCPAANRPRLSRMSFAG